MFLSATITRVVCVWLLSPTTSILEQSDQKILRYKLGFLAAPPSGQVSSNLIQGGMSVSIYIAWFIQKSLLSLGLLKRCLISAPPTGKCTGLHVH